MNASNSLSIKNPILHLPSGVGVTRRVLDEKKGLQVESVGLRVGSFAAGFCNVGARLLHLQGADGVNVVVGHNDLDSILNDQAMMGVCVGRVCNRIRDGELTIEGQGRYQLVLNDGPHHLHGGPGGLHQKIWDIESLDYDQALEEASVVMTVRSEDGEQGYPGDLFVRVRYILRADGTLAVEFEAKSQDMKTPVNLTHHAYWNLDGAQSSENILRHELEIECSRILSMDEAGIPDGSYTVVEQSLFDFRKARAIGDKLPEGHGVTGFDNFYVRDGAEMLKENLPRLLMARVKSLASKRCLEVSSDQAGFQFYTGNFLKPPFQKHQAFCIEPSAYIDAVHHGHFPSILVNPGETRRQTIVYRLRGS